MNERTFRFPAGWEWLQLRQPFAEDLHQQSIDALEDVQLQLDLIPSMPSRVKRTNTDKLHESGVQVNIASNRERLKQEQARERLLALKLRMPECSSWLDDCFERSANHIAVHRLEDGQPLLYGTLLVQLSDDKKDIEPLRYWVTATQLITIHEDWRLSIRTQQSPWDMQLQQCASGGEALATMMSVVLDQLHHGLDSFEKKLIDQEQALRSREQQIQRMNLLFDCRYDLLHWQRLFVPMGELNNALKEAFSTSGPLINSEAYARLQHKLERIDALLQAYARELDTLIAMGEAASTQRGNDTLKVLANVAILLAPTIAIGAIWGMNIRSLPFIEESWSFPAMCAIDLVLTIIAWQLLWQSGWLGQHPQQPSPATAEGAGRKLQEPPPVGTLSRVRSGTKKQAASDSAADIPSNRVLNFTESSTVDKPRSRH
jgi:magnesium transporter